MTQMKKGSGNRVAESASVLGDGSQVEDHNHVRKVTPLQTKMREMQNDRRYRTALSPDTVDKPREARTTVKRRDKDVKPL